MRVKRRGKPDARLSCCHICRLCASAQINCSGGHDRRSSHSRSGDGPSSPPSHSIRGRNSDAAISRRGYRWCCAGRAAGGTARGPGRASGVATCRCGTPAWQRTAAVHAARDGRHDSPAAGVHRGAPHSIDFSDIRGTEPRTRKSTPSKPTHTLDPIARALREHDECQCLQSPPRVSKVACVFVVVSCILYRCILRRCSNKCKQNLPYHGRAPDKYVLQVCDSGV